MSFDFTTSDLSKETPFLFNAPNYLIDLTKMVRQHKTADLMVIRANYPVRPVRPRRRLRGRPAVAHGHLQLDRP